MERKRYVMKNHLFGCEFGESGGNAYVKVWILIRPGLPVTHTLNLPDRSFKLYLESFDGYSKAQMRRAAYPYGFTLQDFIKTVKEKKNYENRN